MRRSWVLVTIGFNIGMLWCDAGIVHPNMVSTICASIALVAGIVYIVLNHDIAEG